MSRVWTEIFPVHTYELDPELRLSIPALAGFLQEAAGHNAHAQGYSFLQLLEKNLTWMLSRLRLRLRELPGWKAQLTVQTWPSGLERLFALRDFRILEGERAIGVATSAWLMLDLQSRRLVRPESFRDWQEIIHPERSVAVGLEKLPGVDGSEPPLQERELPVRYADLDINLHVNNTRYVEWLLEAVPLEILRDRRLAELDIDFLAGAEHGERILSRAYSEGPRPGRQPQAHLNELAFRHILLRQGDGREVARARSLWV
jgi:medium-chain acyl-[acyl-carrier-protein] hydrolase